MHKHVKIYMKKQEGNMKQELERKQIGKLSEINLVALLKLYILERIILWI